MSLEELSGIGKATVEKLRKLGVTTVQALACRSSIELGKQLGEENAKKLILEARKLSGVKMICADELIAQHANAQQLSTGSAMLNELLGGGLETQTITEFYGEYGVGKSQLCHQLAVNAQLPRANGGLDGGVVYVDTENTFRWRRIQQIAEAKGLDPKQTLHNITYAKVVNVEHQLAILSGLDEQVKDNNIRLIILDSLVAHFRSEYIARETLATRQQLLNQHLRKLIQLIEGYNVVGVVTNQVLSQPDAYGFGTYPTGGHILAHASHTRVWIRRAATSHGRIARLIVSPTLPEGKECQFRITANGIEDAVEEEK